MFDEPTTIEKLEARLSKLHIQMADPTFYQGPQKDIAVAQKEANEAQKQLDTAFERWEELEA